MISDCWRATAEDLRAANFDAPLPDDVMAWKYRKLISNLGNAFQALVARNGDWRPLVAEAEAEARRVLDAAGIAYTSEEEESLSAGGRLHHEAGPRRAGVRRRIDLAVADPRHRQRRDRLSERRDRPDRPRDRPRAPINARLARLARQAAAAAHQPGDLSADELAALLRA